MELESFVEHKACNLFPELLPQHKIFISHSGKQKDFAEQLCEDLERWGYYPFFDKREDSLPKGEKFPPLIFKAARECLLAIVLLSKDFFTGSKWPMLELAAFVQAQKSREDLWILPVLLDLSLEDLQNTAKWSERWKDWGKQDGRLDSKVIHEWESAIRALKPVNLLSRSSYNGEVPLRKDIVRAVMKMMPPDVRPDISNVQGKERLCKEILFKFLSVPTSSKICESTKVLGVYGIGGVGKSTLCMIFTDFLRSEFEGRVCHMVLGTGINIVNLQCKALKQLTRANEDFLNMHINTKEEGLACLRERMPRQRIFLAVDNVFDSAESIEAARMFLRLRFHPNSMVLVTSRSQDVLQRSLGIPERSCVLCPSVTAEEALQIILDHVNLPSTELLTEEQEQILHQTVERCNFGGYHPLSLKVLAAQLGSIPSSWRVSDLDLHEASDIDHPLFSAIETSYLNLPDQQIRDMFLDIALFTPENLHTIHEISKWLSDTIHYSCDVDRIKKKLNILRVKSLLEVWKMDDENVRIHDLHRELAKRKARVQASDVNVSRFVYQRGGEAAPKELSIKDLARIVERAGFVEARFRRLDLSACLNLQLLSLRRCEKLATLCLHGLPSLVSLELSVCPLEILDLKGLRNLRWLYVSSGKNLMELHASESEFLACVSISKCAKLEELTLRNCDMLRSVSVSYNDNLEYVYLGKGQSLDCLTLWFCRSLTRVEITGVVHLSTVNKRGCPRLLSVQGCNNMFCDVKCMCLTLWHKVPSEVITALEGSKLLQVLDLWECPMSRLPDLRACSSLRELRLSDVDVLLDSDNQELLHEYVDILCASVYDLELPTSIEELSIGSCRNVVVKEICWKLRGLRDLRLLSVQRVRVAWDWELYRSNGQHMLKASSLTNTSTLIPLHDVEMSSEVVSSREVLHKRISMIGKEMKENIEVNCSLYQVMHWIQEFLKGKKNITQSVQDLNTKICLLWERHVDPFIVGHEGIGLLSWDDMDKAAEIASAQGGIVEQAFHVLCNHCDTLCECLWKYLKMEGMEYSELGKANQIIEMCQKATAKEIKRQLHFLTAVGSQNFVMHDELETWEESIIEEVGMWEKVRALESIKCTGLEMIEVAMWEKRLIGEGVMLISPAVETLAQRLIALEMCRGWKFQNGIEINAQEGFKQSRWDWLRSCKVGISIEQLKFCLAKQASTVVEEVEVRNTLNLHLQWIQQMMREIDLLMQSEMEKLWSAGLARGKSGRKIAASMRCHQERWCEGLLRCWKMCQWLQELEACLSQKLMQADKPVTEETSHESDTKYQMLIKLREQLQSLKCLMSYGVEDDEVGPVHLKGMREIMKEMDLLIQSVMEKMWSDALVLGKAERSSDRRLRMWLHHVGRWLSRELMQEGNPVTEEAHTEMGKHLQYIDLLISGLGPASEADKAKAAVKENIRSKLGMMKALMTVGESPPDGHKPRMMKESELNIWKRADRFPLRWMWDMINTHQIFDLPINNCCMLRHLHISNCRLAIPNERKIPTSRERCCIYSMEQLEKQNFKKRRF